MGKLHHHLHGDSLGQGLTSTSLYSKDIDAQRGWWLAHRHLVTRDAVDLTYCLVTPHFSFGQMHLSDFHVKALLVPQQDDMLRWRRATLIL